MADLSAKWLGTGKKYVPAPKVSLTGEDVAQHLKYGKFAAVHLPTPSGQGSTPIRHGYVPEKRGKKVIRRWVPDNYYGFWYDTYIAIFYEFASNQHPEGADGWIEFNCQQSPRVRIPYHIPATPPGDRLAYKFTIAMDMTDEILYYCHTPDGPANNVTSSSQLPEWRPAYSDLLTPEFRNTQGNGGYVLPCDYFRDINIHVSDSALRVFRAGVVLNGVALLDTDAPALGLDWAKNGYCTANILLTDLIREYIQNTIILTAGTTDIVLRLVLAAIARDLGKGASPKYFREEYDHSNAAPQEGDWPRYGDRFPQPQVKGQEIPQYQHEYTGAFKCSTEDWCTCFACWCIWQALGWFPIRNASECVQDFMNAELFISPLANVPYTQNRTTYRVILYEDLGNLVKPGFYAEVNDAHHATIFVRWVDAPGSFEEAKFDPWRTVEIRVGGTGPAIKVRGQYFLGIGGNQGEIVRPEWYLVVTPTAGWPGQEIFDDPNPFAFGHFSPAPAIFWYDKVRSHAGHGAGPYMDGFGDPRFKR